MDHIIQIIILKSIYYQLKNQIYNKDDYIDIFGKDINSYNQSVSIDYIFIEDKELKSILINEQQYFIPCYNKLSYHDIKEDITIKYESFGATKDIIILPMRNDINIKK